MLKNGNGSIWTAPLASTVEFIFNVFLLFLGIFLQLETELNYSDALWETCGRVLISAKQFISH